MFIVLFISRLSNNFCSQAEKGVYWMKHALCAFKQPVPADAAAREELMARALYRTMKEDNFSEAYRLVVSNSGKGDGAG